MNALKVGIVGSGQMGGGIAALFSTVNRLVTVVDVSDAALLTAKVKLNEWVKRSLITEDAALNIRYTTNLEALSECDFVLEAISENIDVKKSLYHTLGNILSPAATLASNTSAFSITELSRYYAFPKQFLGIHFMNPVLKMPLVEVIAGEETSLEVVSFALELMKTVDKTAVKVLDSPGFIVNRLLIPMINQAFQLLNNGVADKEAIDAAMVLGASFPMGPLKLADFIGLDTCLSIMQTLHKAYPGGGYEPSPFLQALVKEGKLGRKTKQGVYNY